MTGQGFYSGPVSWCVSRDAHSLPPKVDAICCPEHLNCRLCGQLWRARGRGPVVVVAAGTRCRTMTSKLCPKLPAPRTASLPHEAPQKDLFIFSQWLFSTVLPGLGGQGGYPPHPIINNGAQSPGRRNSPCTQGLFLITASGCVSEYALADDGHPPPTTTTSSSALPWRWAGSLSFVRFLGWPLVLLQFTDMSTAAGPQAWQALTVVFTIYGHQSSGAVSRPASFPSFALIGCAVGLENGGIWESVVRGSHWVKCKERLTLCWFSGVCEPGLSTQAVLLAEASVYKRDDDPTSGGQRGAGFYIPITLLK